MKEAPRRLTFLQINDLHGYVEPHPELVRDDGEWRFTTLGGAARIATLFRQVREETSGAVVALDNGDTFGAEVHERKSLDIDAITALRRLFARRGALTPSAVQTVYEV